MFKNILIPTDGSALSQKAATKGVELAKALGAKVTAFFAAPPATPDRLSQPPAGRLRTAGRARRR